MTPLTKENLNNFIDYVHNFHDSTIEDVKLDYKKSKIILDLNVFWSGTPTIKKDGTYETYRTKMKMYFEEIEQFRLQETYQDYIESALLKFIKIKNEEFFCFASDEQEPSIAIVSKKAFYEELMKNKK